MTMYRDSRFEMVNTPETWWELVPFIGAGLLALLFTAILVLLVEDADPKVVSTSETVSAPTVTAQQGATFEGRLPRFVGLAEKGHMDDEEEISLTLSRKGTFNILKWFSLGMQSLVAQPSSPSSKPGPTVSSPSRQPSRKAKNVPPPLSRLPIVRSATVFPRNLLVYPAPAVSEQELERPTTPTTPTSPPVTPLTPMSPPPTPMLSMAKLIMHRHDQANRKARRARQYAQQQQQLQQQQQQHQPLTQILVQ